MASNRAALSCHDHVPKGALPPDPVFALGWRESSCCNPYHAFTGRYSSLCNTHDHKVRTPTHTYRREPGARVVVPTRQPPTRVSAAITQPWAPNRRAEAQHQPTDDHSTPQGGLHTTL